MHSLLMILLCLPEAPGPDLIPKSRILPGSERQAQKRPESIDLKSNKHLKRLWGFVDMALKFKATKILEFEAMGFVILR